MVDDLYDRNIKILFFSDTLGNDMMIFDITLHCTFNSHALLELDCLMFNPWERFIIKKG